MTKLFIYYNKKTRTTHCRTRADQVVTVPDSCTRCYSRAAACFCPVRSGPSTRRGRYCSIITQYLPFLDTSLDRNGPYTTVIALSIIYPAVKAVPRALLMYASRVLRRGTCCGGLQCVIL